MNGSLFYEMNIFIPFSIYLLEICTNKSIILEKYVSFFLLLFDHRMSVKMLHRLIQSATKKVYQHCLGLKRLLILFK